MRNVAAILLALVLALLAAPVGAAGAGQGGNATERIPFVVELQQNNTRTTCPAGEGASAVCLQVRSEGTVAGLGLLQMERLAILRQAQDPSAPPCPEARTSGTFTAAGGDVLRVEGTGTFCRADGSARYTFTFGGGTGRFQGASGGGALVVPPLATGALDRWDGELFLADQAAGGGQAPRMPNTGA